MGPRDNPKGTSRYASTKRVSDAPKTKCSQAPWWHENSFLPRMSYERHSCESRRTSQNAYMFCAPLRKWIQLVVDISLPLILRNVRSSDVVPVDLAMPSRFKHVSAKILLPIGRLCSSWSVTCRFLRQLPIIPLDSNDIVPQCKALQPYLPWSASYRLSISCHQKCNARSKYGNCTNQPAWVCLLNGRCFIQDIVGMLIWIQHYHKLI